MQNPVATVTSLPFKMHLCSPLLPSSPLLTTQNKIIFGHFNKLLHFKKYPVCKRFHLAHIRAQSSSGVTGSFSSAAEASQATQENANTKDKDTVFVAGATGRVGSRTVRELLKLGFQVRAGVRSAQRAESLVQSVREMKLDSEITSGLKPIEKLEIVECDLEKAYQIVPAFGRASVVICCIGASEKEVFDITGPYRIDYQASKNLIDAASTAKVDHFILLTSLGTNKVGFPAAILNLFWGVLIWKRKAEEALIASGLSYTIVRPGGMERPTDSYKETHNMILSQEDTLFGGQVSNLQVAELIAFMAQNRKLSYCKIVEVVAETTAPLTPMGELLLKIPSKREDIQQAQDLDAKSRPLDPRIAEVLMSEVATAVAEEKMVQNKSVMSTPLSPYTTYDDLKPPSSPTPTAPSSEGNQIASANAQLGTSLTPSTVSEGDVDTSEKTTEELQQMRPLSPYAVYEDLKPPSSPSPSPPSNFREGSVESSQIVGGAPKVIDGTLADNDQKKVTFVPVQVSEVVVDTYKKATEEVQQMRPLSPYAAYEDLKPPSSSSPSPPGNSREESVRSSKIMDGVPKVIDGSLAENDPKELTFFPVYDDFRLPTTSIAESTNSLAKDISLEDSQSPTKTPAADPVIPQNTEDGQSFTERKQWSLSPYTMYDDMKPPSSPMPPKDH